MTRAELAQQVFVLIKRNMPEKKSNLIWIAIAKTDDKSLLDEYEKLITKNYALKSPDDEEIQIQNYPEEKDTFQQMDFTQEMF